MNTVKLVYTISYRFFTEDFFLKTLDSCSCSPHTNKRKDDQALLSLKYN